MTQSAAVQIRTTDDLDVPKAMPRGRGRPPGDQDAKRAELLAAAIETIAEEGYANASLRRVAQRAGCTTGALTYYFANKETMVKAVIESLFDKFDTLLEGQESVDVRAIFERGRIWTDTEQPELWLALFQLLPTARHEPALAEVFKSRYAKYRKELTAILARGQKQGLIRSDFPADLLADEINAIGDGWMMAFPIDPERFVRSRVEALHDMTIAMITPQTDTGCKDDAGKTRRAGARPR